MPLQPDLLGPPSLTAQPVVGQNGPRLWVKRLAIWQEPGGEKIRDISFRPGLNIIWSPDGGDALSSESPTDAIGHGSGKTLFCRAYCANYVYGAAIQLVVDCVANSRELTKGLLHELQREHTSNQARMQIELGFLDHLMGMLSLDGVSGYNPQGSSTSITRSRPHGTLHVLDLQA